MGFYEQIAPYYDYIFPADREQLEFIKESAGEQPKKLLDIACGTGAYAINLAQAGFDIWATDIDAEMVRLAGKRAFERHASIKVLVSDMLRLDKYISDKFDCVYCIGNSIVHLGSREAILAAVIQMKERLNTDGSLLLQIINFDRILEKGITALPSIINSDMKLEFYRNYSSDPDTGLIHFDTVLIVKNDIQEKRYVNRINLFPLVASELKSILKSAGFSKISFYGGFNKEVYIAGESFLLVVKAAI